jgi:hypothetical protein
VFTLHVRDRSNWLHPWIEFLDEQGSVGQASLAAAVASGLSALIALKRKPGHLLGSLAQLGIPIIEGEVGGRGEIS